MLLYSRRTGIFLLIIALLVSWARVAAHIHNPRDIVGSFVIAAIAVVVVRVVTKWWRARGKTSSWRSAN
jgi:membrane-associated phospholipid phosphatase